MPRALSYVVGLFGAMTLAMTCAGCSSFDETPTESRWGDGATRFFQQLSLTHSADDLYGTLDFYSGSATIDMSRAELSGEVSVVDRLRWNSGDLNHEVLATYLDSDAALNLVRWESNDEVGVVFTTLDDGVVSHQTVYDLGGALARGLRTTPSVVSQYEDLYDAYGRILNSGDADDLGNLYAPDAIVHDSLLGTESTGTAPTLAERSEGLWTHITGTQVPGTQDAAIYVGPADYGHDPSRAVGLYLTTDTSGCVHQVAVQWLFNEGLIFDERWYHDIDSHTVCMPTERQFGWWTGLELPRPRDSVLTSRFHTAEGQEIDIFNGAERLQLLVDSAMVRFADIGIQEPRIASVTFEPSRSCANRTGRVIDTGGHRKVFICFYESDLCPTAEACTLPSSSVRLAVLHELAHAWMLDHITDSTKEQVLALSERVTWQGNSVPWIDRGVEYAADVIAWGLIEGDINMVRIGSPDCADLTAAFRLLTSTDPLRSATDCNDP